MNNETKKHVHAELIKAWADGAKIQCFDSLLNKWDDCPDPVWLKSTKYRIKPEESTTVEPEHGRTYWWLNRQGDPVPSIFDEMCDSKVLNYGNCFRTPEAAEEAAKAVKSLLLAIHENKPFAWNCEPVVKQDLTTEPSDKKRKPESYKRYWYFDDEGEVFDAMWTGCETDQERYEHGNCFPSKSDCEHSVERIKALLACSEEALKEPTIDCAKVDGKPMTIAETQIVRDYRLAAASSGKHGLYYATKGEYALIEALRKFRISKVFEADKSVLVDVSENRASAYETHIALWSTFSAEESEERVRKALKQIMAEQEANK